MDGALVDEFDAASASRETPETRLLQEAESRDLRAAIESLPATLGQTTWLRDIEELSYAEIAKRLAIPIGTVMSRLSRARELLYRRLTSESRASWRPRQ
jgi:RNA polymerase sigma-70 factor (ECF subfamily)